MPVDREIAADLASTVVDLYRGLETRLAGALALEVRRNPTPSETEKLAAIRRMRRGAERTLELLNDDADGEILASVTKAYVRGGREAFAELANADVNRDRAWWERHGLIIKALARLFGVAERKNRKRRDLLERELVNLRDVLPGVDAIQVIANELTQRMSSTHLHVLRWNDDAYRKVIAESAVDVLAGTSTRRRAAQVAWERLLSQGIKGITYRDGSRRELASYVEMAMRSSVAQAAVQAHADRLGDAGINLVMVSDAPQECKMCRPFEGQILSRSGPTGRIEVAHELTDEPMTITVKATLAEAVAKGFMHPNCRHRLMAYLPGVTKRLTHTQDPQGDRDRQYLRALERRLRKAKLKAAAVIDPDAKPRLNARVRDLQAQIRDHVTNTTVMRQRGREQVGVAR